MEHRRSLSPAIMFINHKRNGAQMLRIPYYTSCPSRGRADSNPYLVCSTISNDDHTHSTLRNARLVLYTQFTFHVSPSERRIGGVQRTRDNRVCANFYYKYREFSLIFLPNLDTCCASRPSRPSALPQLLSVTLPSSSYPLLAMS